VIKWFQIRENQRDAEILSSKERSFVRYRVVGRTCYCRGFVATHRKIIKGIPQRMWVELLRDGGSI